MKTFRYTGSVEEIERAYNGSVVDCIEGCLLDSVLISSAKGMIAMIETAVNCWTSAYTVYVGKASEVEDKWYEFMDEMGVE